MDPWKNHPNWIPHLKKTLFITDHECILFWYLNIEIFSLYECCEGHIKKWVVSFGSGTLIIKKVNKEIKKKAQILEFSSKFATGKY